MRPFAERTLQKISPLTENEYAELAIFAADEVWPGLSGSRRHRAGKSTALWKRSAVTASADTVSYWTTGRNVSVRSLFPIHFYASGFRLPYFLLISCCMQSYSRPRTKSVVVSAAHSLYQNQTASNTAQTAESVLPADRQPSAWGNGARRLRNKGEKSLDLQGINGVKLV